MPTRIYLLFLMCSTVVLLTIDSYCFAIPTVRTPPPLFFSLFIWNRVDNDTTVTTTLHVTCIGGIPGAKATVAKLEEAVKVLEANKHAAIKAAELSFRKHAQGLVARKKRVIAEVTAVEKDKKAALQTRITALEASINKYITCSCSAFNHVGEGGRGRGRERRESKIIPKKADSN